MLKVLRNYTFAKSKLISIILTGVLLIGLTGCRSTSSTSGNNTGTNSNANYSTNANNSASTTVTKSDSYYKGTYGTYEIKNIEQMTAKFGGKQIITITMNYTNTTDKPQDPWFAIVLDMSVTQETNTTVEQLDGANGLFPDGYKTEAVKLGDTEIKPGATVEAVVGYELLYPGSPVYMRDSNLGGKDGTKFERIVQTNK